MTETAVPTFQAAHSHVFLGEGHEINERKAWTVIILCVFMMLVEIVGVSCSAPSLWWPTACI
jgi:Co/Zn/Cd efflux system component